MPCVGDVGQNPHLWMQLAGMHLTNASRCIYPGVNQIQPARRGILESPWITSETPYANMARILNLQT